MRHFWGIFVHCWAFYSYNSRKQEKKVVWSWIEMLRMVLVWPFTKGYWKSHQKLVFVGGNQKLNIAQIFPLTMYPIVLQCFASLTWRNLLSYLCEQKKKIFFLSMVFENHHKCIICRETKSWILAPKSEISQNILKISQNILKISQNVLKISLN